MVSIPGGVFMAAAQVMVLAFDPIAPRWREYIQHLRIFERLGAVWDVRRYAQRLFGAHYYLAPINYEPERAADHVGNLFAIVAMGWDLAASLQ
jgi:hypothetical protein